MLIGSDHREVRKVQFTGKSTYVLSLPKRWIEEMHLKAGDQVALIRELDNSLSILPFISGLRESVNEVTAIVLPDDSSSTVKRKVVSMYLAGYDIIHLKSKSGRINPALRDGVREVVRRNLIGTEIIADASDKITLQVLLSMPELSISTAIRRMYLIASSMHRDAMFALTELNYELAKEVIKSDDEVDRFSLYIFRNLAMAMQNGRMLREMGLENPSNCLSYRVAAKSIERVADHACGIADKATKLKDKIPEKSLQKIDKMSHLALTVLENSVEALLQGDYHLADKTVDTAENIRTLEDEVMASLEKDNMHDQANIKLALESIRRTAEYASDIAEVAINETIGEVTEKHSVSRRR
ncbi:MAG: PhoU family transcriptional regulator [Thermoproteota archaeon]|nr:PhoU family transcriptional regulator [Thermoproteota archaeon]